MSYLILGDKSVCPHCHRRTHPTHFNGCKNCGTMLFLRPIQFDTYEADGALRHYWLFTKNNGWVHRDRIMEPDNPVMVREWQPKKPEPNNWTTPEEIAGNPKLFKKKAERKAREQFPKLQHVRD